MSVDDAEVRPPPPRARARRSPRVPRAPRRSPRAREGDPRATRRSRLRPPSSSSALAETIASLTSAPLLAHPSPHPPLPRSQARTALRRGAALLKYCRNAKPHVSHFQLAEDELELVWVSKSAAEKRLRCAWIRDVALGRSGSDLFRKSTGKDRDHAPELCLSVLYDEHESDLAKGKPARTLDLVCESPAKAATWARGLLLARDRARNPPPKPPPLSAKTAFLVSKAVNKFRKNKKPFPEEYDTGPIAEPGDVHVWGFLHASMASSEELARAKAAADERERRDAKDDARRTASERASLNPLLHIQPPASLRSSLASPPRSFPAWTAWTSRRLRSGDRSAVGVSSAGGGGRGGGTCAWGDASGGRLGTADLSSIARREPARVGGLGGGFRAVACGRGVALAVGADGGWSRGETPGAGAGR